MRPDLHYIPALLLNGLRDYGTATWVGGDPACDHKRDEAYLLSRNVNGSTLGGGKDTQKNSERASEIIKNCPKCGASRVDAQIGLERTLDEYVSNLVLVFREVWRVLRDDGTAWIVIGDSYTSGGRDTRASSSQLGDSFQKNSRAWSDDTLTSTRPETPKGLKPKDLCMVPARVAMALQADGWYLRSEIIWAKAHEFCSGGVGSTMPESVTDRPVRAHETVFLLTKSPRYFYDNEAVKQQGVYPAGTQAAKGSGNREGNRRSEDYAVYSGERQLRDVWSISPHGYREAHFATFPVKLVEPPILAGTSARGQCPTCGSPWTRAIRAEGGRDWHQDRMKPKGIVGELAGDGGYKRGQSMEPLNNNQALTTEGWQPSCTCYGTEPLPEYPEPLGDASDDLQKQYDELCEQLRAIRQKMLAQFAELPVVQQIVLDPFCGSGTVGEVCRLHARRFVGVELNHEYCLLAQKRGRGQLGMAFDE